MSPSPLLSPLPPRGLSFAPARAPLPGVLAALLGAPLREGVNLTLAPSALAAELRLRPETAALQDALEAGSLPRGQVQVFLRDQIEQVCRFSTFVHDLSLAALVVAVDRTGVAYRGSLLRALAYFPSSRLELSRPVAFSCLGPGGRFDPFALQPGVSAPLRLRELGVLPAAERTELVKRIVELALGLPGDEVRALVAEKQALEQHLGLPESALAAGLEGPGLRASPLALRWRAVLRRLAELGPSPCWGAGAPS